MGRPGGDASPRVAELTESESRALDLRIAGRTFQQIADALGTSRTSAYRWVNEALAKSDAAMAAKGEAHRELEAQRLDALLGALWAVAIGERTIVASDPDATTDVAFDASVKATDRVLRIMERRAKLLGLDAPARTEVTGAGGGPLEVETLRATFLDRIARLRAARDGGGGGG